ncbi:MAG TPA: molybdopterin cofactor-binding domain-containing protein [Terriglobia bacterium]|nr:molybdopterin cofactor-binding domain-containing protein [Terriglobia bacterium]
MSKGNVPEITVEPERYELQEAPLRHFDLDRRDFFKLAGGGVAVFLLLPKAVAQESGHRGSRFREALPQNIGAWLHIGEDGAVTVYTGKAEMGQNIRTSLTQAVAEELHVKVGDISLVMGDTDVTPFDMGTFGSRTTPTMNKHLRQVASVARDLLVGLAAKRWDVPPSLLVAEDGKVLQPNTTRSVSYAELAQGQTLAQAVVENDPLTPAADWKVAGTSVAKVNGRAFVTGEHQFASDIRRPGMMFGKVVRPSAFGATLDSLDVSKAKAMPGVTVVHDGDFVGVVAPSEFEAKRAAASIRASWKTTPQPSSAELFDYLKSHAESSGRGDYVAGSMKDGLAAARHRLKATFTIAYIQHAPLEPRAAVAEWDNGKLTAWTGSQRPFGVQQQLEEVFHLSNGNCRVIVPDTGGAYGGKHTGECAIEAARLARAAGKPVKLVWTREEEFAWAYFRPSGVIEIASGVDENGLITAWEFHNYNSGEAAIRTPYDVPNQHIEFHEVNAPLRQGSYRSLAATANHFARESHMDELAHRAKMDPLEFRLKNLKNQRLKFAFTAAAEAFGWKTRKPSKGHGFGMGGGVEKGGYVATCAEVAVDHSSGEVRVVRVTSAFDCGAVVNPNGLRNQIVGANVMGLGGALFEAIEFKDGRITNGTFTQYRVPRFQDVPEIQPVLIDRKDQPSAGAGETPICGLAPAIGNAIFDATGKRIYSMPMVPNGLKKA